MVCVCRGGGSRWRRSLQNFPTRPSRWIPSSPTVLDEIRQLTKTSQRFHRQFFTATKPLVSMICSPSLEANEAALLTLFNLAVMDEAHGRILEPIEKLKGGSRSRTPRPSSKYRDEYRGYKRRSRSRSRDKYYGRDRDCYRSMTRNSSRSPDYHRRHGRGRYDDDYDDEISPSRYSVRTRSPPRRSRSPSRSRSPKGGGNEKASASSPHSHGRADSRSPLQCFDSDNFFHQIEATVLMALLHLAPETFDLFDDLVVLSEGHVVYEGQREQLLQLFDSLGFQKPLRKGTADLILRGI
ncbi:unnamed protein product [Lactuca saligna]|uniref:Uncharacterized protein n=1 Tax=Lactuca saligna TaxID=75948 RepID=A0AA35ZV72_LACSI|nr:unnamed protein product [Lactuca saligna]